MKSTAHIIAHRRFFGGWRALCGIALGAESTAGIAPGARICPTCRRKDKRQQRRR